ncbi:MAG: hypothetical protein OCU22_04530 [Canidatus Methanoxibalbensis ujae]|nr:hypothetical protein [Candidatus Methanoxibalbensis ujae]
MNKMWKKVDVVFKLKSPLHIGYIPFKGSVVSPTRYYVPGRNLWGAITKRVTEYLCEKPKADDYKRIGRQVIENFRLSYFYLYDGRTIYFPRYTDEGLKYGNNKEEITKSEFERRFIGSLISTAIDSNGTAKDESLHEIEFINNRFKDETGDLKDVKIAGCIWIKENAKIEDKKVIINDKGIFIENFNIIQELILGGESKYGFGHVLLDSINRVESSNLAPFKWKNPEKIEIKSNEHIVFHLKYDKNINFKGDIELLAGRGYFDPQNCGKASDKPGKVISKPEYYLSPGTKILHNQFVKILHDGRMQCV